MAKLRSRSTRYRGKKSMFRNTKRKTVSQKMRKSESLLVIIGAVFLCTASISYILQTNGIATRGYEVEACEKQLAQLKSDNQNLKNQEAELRSIKNLDDQKGRLTALSSTDIGYVNTGGAAVAMRE